MLNQRGFERLSDLYKSYNFAYISRLYSEVKPTLPKVRQYKPSKISCGRSRVTRSSLPLLEPCRDMQQSGPRLHRTGGVCSAVSSETSDGVSAGVARGATLGKILIRRRPKLGRIWRVCVTSRFRKIAVTTTCIALRGLRACAC